MTDNLPNGFARKSIVFCEKCGSVVTDWAAHERFHDFFEHMAKKVQKL